MREKEIIADIYENCFSEVTDEYLDKIAKEIVKKTCTQTAIIHRLLTRKEYIDIKYNEGCPPVELVVDEDSSDEESDDDKSIVGDQIQYLFVKACYSTLKHPTIVKYTAVPIACLPTNSPFLKTIESATYAISQQTPITDSVYPEFQSFVSVRLDHTDIAIGLITVMDNKPLQSEQIHLIESILKAVQLRTKNEIARIRQKDNLIMMKNAALSDAESKIKFLAEMSHEIRTPMSAVVALTDLMLQERHLLNDEQAEHLDVIQTSGNHLLTVINDILDISKINHDPQFKLEFRRFSIRKSVKDVLNMARHQVSMTQTNKIVSVVECPKEIDDDVPVLQLIQQLESRNLVSTVLPRNTNKVILPLIWKIDSDIPEYLMGDSMRITQILLNLCSNALKFTKSGGIQVRINRSKGTQRAYHKERYDAKVEEHPYTRSSYKATKNLVKPVCEPIELNDGSEKIILEISVTDTGIGMPADRMPRLFKSFSQIDISTARRYGGTGLGLAITSMLVNRMGGGLWVESEEKHGSRFALTLPLTVAEPLDALPSPSSSVSDSSERSPVDYFDHQQKKQHNNYNIPNSNSSNNNSRELQRMVNKQKPVITTPKKPQLKVIEQPLRQLNILLAEDNILNQKIAVSILKRLGYQDVIIAGNGREALELMQVYSFDIIFMDLYMPEMDGLEATRQIISQRKDSQGVKLLNVDKVYIIALTASASKQDRQICIDAGMNDFISKPFTMTEMQSALKKLQ